MDKYELNADDPRIGRRTEEKIYWPKVDITGAAYERPVAATRNIGGDTFVVLPVNFRGEILMAGVPVASAAPEIRLAGDGKPMALPEFAPVKSEPAGSIADSTIPALRSADEFRSPFEPPRSQDELAPGADSSSVEDLSAGRSMSGKLNRGKSTHADS